MTLLRMLLLRMRLLRDQCTAMPSTRAVVRYEFCDRLARETRPESCPPRAGRDVRARENYAECDDDDHY